MENTEYQLHILNINYISDSRLLLPVTCIFYVEKIDEIHRKVKKKAEKEQNDYLEFKWRRKEEIRIVIIDM